VYIHYLANSRYSNYAPILIKGAYGSYTKRVNMQTGGGVWYSLGSFTLNAGTSNYVQFSDSSGTVNVDGVKFEPVP
jgi:hypothetical protein